MKKSSKVFFGLILTGILSSGTLVYADAKTDAKVKVEQAVQNKTFYSYMMAYIDILNLPEDQQGELLNKLAPVFADANTPAVQKARTMLENVAKNKDGKIYAETEVYLNSIKENDMDAFTRDYLLGELTSWGRQFVFTEDYTQAVDSLMEIGKYKTYDSYKKALETINKTKNTASKEYLLGELANAKKAYNIADQSNETTEEANGDVAQYLKKAKELLAKEDYEAVIEQVEKVIAIKSDIAEAYNIRGVAYTMNEEYDNALDDFFKAVELDGNNAVYYFNRGSAFFSSGDVLAALQDCSKAINLDSNMSRAYGIRAYCYYVISEPEKALEDANKALSIDPKDSYALLTLEKLK